MMSLIPLARDLADMIDALCLAAHCTRSLCSPPKMMRFLTYILIQSELAYG